MLIIENEIVKIEEAKAQINMLKECLWLRFIKKRNWRL